MGGRILGVGITGKTLTKLERRLLHESPPFAVVLFGRNVETVRQLRILVADIKATASVPPVIMIDEEGGRVDRLRNLVRGLPSAEAFGHMKKSKDLVRWFGKILGEALRYFDIEINLAPVVDLKHDPPAKGLERRCYGEDPETVIWLAGAFIKGQHQTGVASCLKHFPGIGRGTADTHYGSSMIDVPLETLTRVELAPYVKLANQAKAVMIGHAVYPQIEDPHLPASLSHKISTELLRDVVGFKGAAISDDMEMHAVADLGSEEELLERALFAGNDVILFCSKIERMSEVIAHIKRRRHESAPFEKRIQEAIGRAAAYRAHCQKLRAKAGAPIESFDALIEEVGRFGDAVEKSRIGGEAAGLEIAPTERREQSRSGGTGKTGREEWT